MSGISDNISSDLFITTLAYVDPADEDLDLSSYCKKRVGFLPFR